MFKEYDENGIILYEAEHFNAKDILTCGQVFRYFDKKAYYTVLSIDKKCDIVEDKNKIRLITDDKDYFNNYFDLDVSYGDIIKRLYSLPFMAKAIDFGKGLRILRQDAFETIVTFIFTPQNKISKVKVSIEKLCEELGEKKDGYFAFPTIEKLIEVDETFFRKIGAGYRAKSLYSTLHSIYDNKFDIECINKLPTANARKILCGFRGIGSKVADCILLFGYYKQDVFPIDTWIKKVYGDIFKKENVKDHIMRYELINLYGELSGYAQQYLFYNKRQ